MRLSTNTTPHGTTMPFAGQAGPVAQGVRVWLRRAAGLPVYVTTGIDDSKSDNCTRVSGVESRHT
jgi:hypothetical protein